MITVCITIFGCICSICAAICYIFYIRNVYVADTDTSHVGKLEDIFYRLHPIYNRYIEKYARNQSFAKEDAHRMFEAIYDVYNMLEHYKFNEE